MLVNNSLLSCITNYHEKGDTKSLLLLLEEWARVYIKKVNFNNNLSVHDIHVMGMKPVKIKFDEKMVELYVRRRKHKLYSDFYIFVSENLDKANDLVKYAPIAQAIAQSKKGSLGYVRAAYAIKNHNEFTEKQLKRTYTQVGTNARHTKL